MPQAQGGELMGDTATRTLVPKEKARRKKLVLKKEPKASPADEEQDDGGSRPAPSKAELRKELAKSVAHGAHDQVKRLLEQRASVDGDLGLAGAVRSNFFAVAGLLLDARADANIPDDEGVSALVRAATRCRPEGAEMVKQLLTCGALLEPNAESEPTKETSTGSFVTDRASFKVADLLVYLLRGEGSAFTNIVEVLLEEVEKYRSERLREHMRTILGCYDDEKKRAKKFLDDKKYPNLKPEDVDLFNLNFQNLLYAPEVQTSLRRLRISAPVACKSAVLKAVAETANEGTLATDTVEALVSAAWLQLRAFTAIDVGLDAVALACLCWVTYACRSEELDAQPALWALAMIQGKEAVEWSAQVGLFLWGHLPCRPTLPAVGRLNFKSEDAQQEKPPCLQDAKSMVLNDLSDGAAASAHPAPSLETFADLLFLVFGFAAIVRQMEFCNDLDQYWLPWFCSMYWLRFAYSLRGERWLGPYLLPILSAVRDTGAFFFVTLLCVASATHAYIILNPRGGDTFPLYSAFTHTIRLAMFGDFDLFEYQGQDTTYVLNATTGVSEPNDPRPEDLGDTWQMTYIYLQLLFFCTGVGVDVLLMNLLIGILSNNYDEHLKRAQVLFVQARARMLLEHQRRPWMRLAKMIQGPGHGKSSSELKMSRCNSFCSWLGITALRPLQPVLAPPQDRAFVLRKEDVFNRVIARLVLEPVSRSHFFAFVISLMSPVLLVLSLASLVTFLAVALVLRILGFQVQGLHYTINLTVFGLFGDRPASECQIMALVHQDTEEQDLQEQVKNLDTALKEHHREQQDGRKKLEQIMQDQVGKANGGLQKQLKDQTDRLTELENMMKEQQLRQAANQEQMRSLDEKLSRLLRLLHDGAA
ncbi:unnamed protein product [Symbiodinium natans]|uniref:Ion transport domain-containing protein n=1 Tax=Symbiodinium natans TaxID=878477 RepID=A0A812IB12_9DINO|nr:unnamed protein product [Symbiodinium natans]